MKLFFGKIPDTTEPEQLIEGYYHAAHKSSWFNGIEPGHYALIIGGGKIQLWKAKEWSKDAQNRQILQFDIIFNETGLSVKTLTEFKYFELSVDLIIKTSRSTGKASKAFFEIKFAETFSEEDLLKKDTYTKKENFRNILTVPPGEAPVENSFDLQIQQEGDKLVFFLPRNAAFELQSKFKDNLKYSGKGQSKKDSTLELVKRNLSTRAKLDMSILDFYDAFMTEYRVDNKERYWVVNGFDQDQIMYDLAEDVFVMQFQYNSQSNGDVTKQLRAAKRIKPGDKVLLYNKNKYYAHGIFEETDLPEAENKNLQAQIEKRGTNKAGGILTFSDAPCYFEDLRDENGFVGKWGQRLNVESWEHVHKAGINISGLKKSITNSVIMNTILELKDDTFYKLVIDKLSGNLQNESSESAMESTDIARPLNQILFGPPGTGKTHYLLEKILPRFRGRTKKKSDEALVAEAISKLPWWKVFALILMEADSLTVPEIKEHRYTKYKLQTSNTNSLNQTVWGQLSSHTINESKTVEYSSRQSILIFDKTIDSKWFIANKKHQIIQELEDYLSELETQISENKAEAANYKFVTFHQSTSYENFVEGIVPVFEDEANESSEILYEVRKGIFYEACDEAAKLAGYLGLKDCLERSKEDRKKKFENAPKYCILIDEINRGNVSSVFGELITLIEEDKRLSKNEIILTLPYSKGKFGVPPNLYIIGTMNTADRSVEALDTALRRRFSFLEMPPKYDLKALKYEFAGIKASSILEIINSRIEKLIDRDHLIGHSYFMIKEDENPKDKLMKIFYRNIIPLLQEYFYGDYAKIGAVLGKGFLYKSSDDKPTVFASGFEMDDYLEKEIYHIIDYRENQPGNAFIQEEMSFEKAIGFLVNLNQNNQIEGE